MFLEATLPNLQSVAVYERIGFRQYEVINRYVWRQT